MAHGSGTPPHAWDDTPNFSQILDWDEVVEFKFTSYKGFK